MLLHMMDQRLILRIGSIANVDLARLAQSDAIFNKGAHLLNEIQRTILHRATTRDMANLRHTFRGKTLETTGAATL